jgi:hypothetical protein
VANILLLGLFGPILMPPVPDDPSNNGSQEESIVVADANAGAGKDGEGITVNEDEPFDLPLPPVEPGVNEEGGSVLASVADSDTAQFVNFDEGAGGIGTDAGGGAGGGGGPFGGPGGPFHISGFGGPGGFGGPPGGGPPGGGPPGGGGGGGGGGDKNDKNGNGDGPDSDLPALVTLDEPNGPAAVPEPAIGLLCAGVLGALTYVTIYRRSRLQPRTARTR